MKNMIILHLLFIMVFNSCQIAESSTFMIPKGYKGVVTIVFNQKNGMPKKYENGRRFYEIPSDGILLTQFKDDYGYIDYQYFYTDSLKNRVRLREFNNAKESQLSNIVGIFDSGTCGVYGNPSDTNSIKIMEFDVSDFKYLDTISSKTYKDGYRQKLVNKVGHDF